MITNGLRNINILDLIRKLMIKHKSSCSIFILNLIKSQFSETISIHLSSSPLVQILFCFQWALLLSSFFASDPGGWCRWIIKNCWLSWLLIIVIIDLLDRCPLLVFLLIREFILLLPRKIFLKINLLVKAHGFDLHQILVEVGLIILRF